MSFLLLLIYHHIHIPLASSERPNLKFPTNSKRLHDDPLPDALPSPFGNKVYLKSKLLDNLNNFFPNTAESLEILGTHDHRHPPLSETNSIIDSISNSLDHNSFPTLIPTEIPIVPSDPPLDLPPPPPPPPSPPPPPQPTSKKRSEGPVVSGKILDSIRDWRKRLYRAFKMKKPKAALSRLAESSVSTDMKVFPASEVLDFKDVTPLVIDKNRQVLLSRKEPDRQNGVVGATVQTFGRDPGGKIVRIFGTQASGYTSVTQMDSPPEQASNDYSASFPITPKRKAYRTPGGRSVVYIPAPPTVATILPPPVTMPPPTLPPLITFPIPPTIAPSFSDQSYTGATPYNPPLNRYPNSLGSNYATPNINVPAQQPIQFPTISPPTYMPASENNDLEDGYGEDDLPQQQVGVMNTCAGEVMCTNNQAITEDKCNSLRLRTVIQDNIVPNDAEASKRAVQSAAESETGQYFDAICGTGFFSYIAHTDEFCLSSMGGVNCYVFSPVCSDTSSTMAFAKHRKSKRRAFLNKN
ncbi:hypothetical protein RB195_014445 [Necator americanus]|uniref:Ground-like domain-containing protein n=1 Tax=Necator americanus TaxID=51031 RepID=A0ABR1E086_NECAM